MDWSKFFAVPNEVTIWGVLNSQFLTTLLAAGFGILLLRYETKLRKAQERTIAAEDALSTRNEAERKEAAAEEKIEAVIALADGGADRRGEAKSLIENAKSYLAKRLEADTDGRHQRTYQTISGHHPADLALALRDRGMIDDDQFEHGFQLFSVWKRFERGKAASKPISQKVFDEMKRLHDGLVRP